MTIPEKKAQELIEKYSDIVDGMCRSGLSNPNEARQCALIDIQNTIDALVEYGSSTHELQNMDRTLAFYDEIKTCLKETK